MINDKHKDRLFSFQFGREEHREWTLSLYNAESYMRNFISFLIEN